MINLIKQLKWVFIDQFTLKISGGGGGSPAPSATQSTV